MQHRWNMGRRPPRMRARPSTARASSICAGAGRRVADADSTALCYLGRQPELIDAGRMRLFVFKQPGWPRALDAAVRHVVTYRLRSTPLGSAT